MRFVLASVPQMIVMAAIVDTALLAPVGGLLALLCFALFGVSFHGFMTFGGELNAFEGLVAWWTLLLIPSLAYAASVMPWHPKD
jgi:hypothetical protein